MKVLKEATDLCKAANIDHVTIQVEVTGTLGDCSQTVHQDMETM